VGEKYIYRILKNSLLYRVNIYLYFGLFFTFFGYFLVYENIILWVILTVSVCAINFFITAHNWLFYNDRIEIQFQYRKKLIVIKYEEIKFIVSNGSRFSGVNLFIRYRNFNKNKIINPYYMYYSNPDKRIGMNLKKIALLNKIKIEGDWNWE
jgi:hypothetical protein